MTFNHVVDKKNIPTVSILGVNIAAINMNWLLAFTKDNVAKLSGDYICVANAHTTVLAYEDVSYRDIQNGGIMAIPDGGPLSLVGRKRGGRNMKRTTGPDYLEEVLKVSAQYGWKHFFYGSTPETLNKLKNEIKKVYPDVLISGMYSPPFRPLSKEEDAKIVDMINATDSDFVWIGLGAPKQEIWMAEHQGKVKGLMVGVGAAFDYSARNLKRAPGWMQRRNLEWTFRLAQEPRRLFKRYLITNSKFIWNVIIRRK